MTQLQILPDGTVMPLVTLRDQFAMAAISGLIVNLQEFNYSDVAVGAYHIADAMMKHREEE